MRKLLILPALAACVAATLAAHAQEAPPAPETPAAPEAQAAPQAPAVPAPYDCTLVEAVLCKAGASCTPSKTLGELPLPARMLVHFERQLLASTGPDGLPHVSTIGSLARSGDIVVAQGVDGGTGWMVHTTHNDDEVTFVAASDDFIINAFGTCKPLAAAAQ
jgi:hypothetical protein